MEYRYTVVSWHLSLESDHLLLHLLEAIVHVAPVVLVRVPDHAHHVIARGALVELKLESVL